MKTRAVPAALSSTITTAIFVWISDSSKRFYQSTRIAAIRVDFCVAAEIQGTCYRVWLKCQNDPCSDIIDHRTSAVKWYNFNIKDRSEAYMVITYETESTPIKIKKCTCT